MLVINGARVESAGYEFGVMLSDGWIWECINYEEAALFARDYTNARVVMRALYQTDWMETFESDN